MTGPRDPERPWLDWVEKVRQPAEQRERPATNASWDEPPHPAEQFSGSSPAARAREPASAPQGGPRIVTVGDLTRLMRDTVRAAPALRDIWVEGEVGQVTISAAGHCYFTLKDERAQLRCVTFRDERRFIRFEPQTGLRMVAHGRIDLFEPQGAIQLYVDALQPAGFGDLALRFEALKATLAAEGLFEPGRKRALPARPAIVGIATSVSGAVLHDILQVLRRRWPLTRVVVAPCQVQGDPAPASIVAALGRLARFRDAERGASVDVVILARGGGSLEDLWPFNEERVVRAVAASPVPVVVGVGHETDVTLAEFAADVRAATPSVAAELVVPSRGDELARLSAVRARLSAVASTAVAGHARTLAAERRALEAVRPAALLAAERERVGLLLDRAARAVVGAVATRRARVERAGDRLPLLAAGRLARTRTDLHAAAGTLAALSPYATLERGYAIVRTPDGEVVRDAARRQPGEALRVRLARGRLDVRVDAVQDSDA